MAHPVASAPVDRILSKLKRVRAAGSGKWMALCPAHDDKLESLSIALGTDGRVLMNCHAKCPTTAIVAAIGLTMGDLFSGSRPTAPSSRTLRVEPASVVVEKAPGVDIRPKLVKTYDYYNADGTHAFQTCRFEPKTFRQRHRGGNGEWIWNLKDVTPVLYRLPEITEAVALDKTIYVVEGEKDAEMLAQYDYAATTSPMGAGKWRESYTKVLAGADVVILPDNDEPGIEHAQQVAADLYANGCSVKIVALPGLEKKGDVSDWLESGGDLDQLESLVSSTPHYSPASMEARRRVRWRLDELLDNDSIMRPPPPIVPRLAWAGRSTLLAAREKSGKSTLTGYIAAQVTRGYEFLGEPCASGDVLIFGLEEFLGDAARRLRHFSANATRIHLVDSFLGDPQTRPQELLSHIDEVDPILVIVDSLAAYSHGQVQDDNNATQMSSVVQPLTNMAHQRGVALIIIHHARKTDGRARGSTAITAGADVVAEFFTPEEDTDPTLRRMRTIGRVPVQPLYDLRFDGDHYRLSQGHDAPIAMQILSVVGSRPGCSINDVCAAVSGRRDDTQREIHKMLASRALVNIAESITRAKLVIPSEPPPIGLAL